MAHGLFTLLHEQLRSKFKVELRWVICVTPLCGQQRGQLRDQLRGLLYMVDYVTNHVVDYVVDHQNRAFSL